ncbi:hypothetical protein [Geotalea sp. SG265]|uniref:hypothetical protein n=1 Tax=Geotalea sp. SG265 TaxID=2922867 RepID=UPI001FAF824F|nr:hypothetical protein [Geotalea sp. SG265]
MTIEFRYTTREAVNILKTLILCETAIVSIYLLSYLLGRPSFTIHALFDLDGEACIPAWFSSMQLFMTGALLWLASRSCRREKPSPLFLKLASAGFIYISADEAAMIHERVGTVLKSLPHVPSIHGHGAWIPFYVIAGLFFVLVMGRHFYFLWRDFRRELIWVLGGMAVFLFGALGMEVIGDLLRSGSLEDASRFYVLEVAIEEFCEMSGMSVVFHGVMRFLLQLHRERATELAPLPTPVISSVLPAMAAVAVPVDHALLVQSDALQHPDEQHIA